MSTYGHGTSSFSSFVSSRGRFAAGLGAPPAGLRARLHLHIPAHPQFIAHLGTPIARFGTHATGNGKQVGDSMHEISRDVAQLSTILQQPDMFRLGMHT
jgi:hypothetical protein